MYVSSVPRWKMYFSEVGHVSISVGMKMLLLCLPTWERIQEIHVSSRLSGPSRRPLLSECTAPPCIMHCKLQDMLL